MILGIAVTVIFFMATAPTFTLPSQCSAFAGPTCNLVQIYTNRTVNYTLITLSLTNSQSVPINITNTIVTLRNGKAMGSCTPSFMYPGEETTCVARSLGSMSLTNIAQGLYQLNAKYCNSGVFNLSNVNCTFENVVYSGSFLTVPQKNKVVVFSVAALQSPLTSNLLPFSAISAAPIQPNNYTALQNSDWVSNITTDGTLAYAFSTNILAFGGPYLGYKTQLYPSTLSSLSNNNININSNGACSGSPPYNSMLSIASTTLWLNSSATSSLRIETGDAMEVFYRLAGPGNAWSNAFTGSAWKSQNPTVYGPKSIGFIQGLYNIEILWSNSCGGGAQVLKISGLPS
jgi:hypothetical protein